MADTLGKAMRSLEKRLRKEATLWLGEQNRRYLLVADFLAALHDGEDFPRDTTPHVKKAVSHD